MTYLGLAVTPLVVVKEGNTQNLCLKCWKFNFSNLELKIPSAGKLFLKVITHLFNSS